jgi:hypothetical protein
MFTELAGSAAPKPRLPPARCEAAVKYIVPTARALISLLGIALVVLGILFWTGHGLSLVTLHMRLGGLFVLCLWVLAVVGVLTRGSRSLAVIVLVWSFIVPALGMTQFRLLPGPYHWVIQTTHLLVGLIAMGLGHSLARRIGRRPATAAAIPESA